jgi:hypothetical protein
MNSLRDICCRLTIFSAATVSLTGRGGDDGHAAGPGWLAGCVEVVGCPVAAICIFLRLSAFVRLCPYRGLRPGGDRLTRRHTVKKVKKTRIQEVPEFRGPGAASRFGRGLAGRAFGRFSAGGIVTRRSGGRKEENGKRGRRLQTSGSRLQKMRQAGMVHSLPEV